MNYLNESVRRLYIQLLAASLGSALIASIYSLVDMAMIGQYQGPSGPAALAVAAPVWNIVYSLGLLMGVGGSILFSAERGRNPESNQSANELYTASLIGALILAAICWIGLFAGEQDLLKAFGADGGILELATAYLAPIRPVLPCFLINQFLSACLRNDGSASLAAWAVLAGGILNIFGDWYFIFVCDLGILGAGIATALGAVLTTLVMLVHFVLPHNTLAIVPVEHLGAKLKAITVSGFSTFFSDIAMGLLTILFNRQILLWLSPDALAVYAILINISTIVQCFGYSIGQAAQPILSSAYGAGKPKRIRQCLKAALISAALFGIGWTLLTWQFPEQLVVLFMKPTEEILRTAPPILCTYALSFLLLPFNLFASYYCQSIMKPVAAFLLSALRGALISGALILILPRIAGPDSLWLAMPITEALVSLAAAVFLFRFTRSLPSSSSAC